jgi:hypothetical protein
MTGGSALLTELFRIGTALPRGMLGKRGYSRTVSEAWP